MLHQFHTLKVRQEEDIVYIQLHRPDSNNTINNQMVNEFSDLLSLCEREAKIVVIEGLPEVFCFGADFSNIAQLIEQGAGADAIIQEQDPEALYAWWLKLITGSYITIAHVRGKVNAGGIGLVAACDIVLAEENSQFSLSEMLFGLMPACVLPFLKRRLGFAKTNYMTLMTQPVTAARALEWGLVDACDANSASLLRRHLLRLRLLNKGSITHYKRYLNSLDPSMHEARERAIQGNRDVFSDHENLQKISRYVTTGKFPWES